ncbi:uncharacterized protein LOC106465528, partial [Limulus polyphemus]|uniref:Uncharacterized protein LOC106465528 n=1 Tax=Limulus polyphemus TaxID=6850 RepID=A0ABM1BFX5_LIMPO
MWKEKWQIPTNIAEILESKDGEQKSKVPELNIEDEHKPSESGKSISRSVHRSNPRSGHGGYGKDDYGPAGTTKAPNCAQYSRYYCSYKEDYPIDIVTTVSKYMKWPFEKLFRDLKFIKMPKPANTGYGALVCDSITRIVRPGWAKNTNGRWLVVINTDYYQQYVTEVICRYENSYCNFVPPCYHATCQQRYNTQYLLVIDPYNPYRGPFLSQFLFPSCCVCHVPNLKPYSKSGKH